MTHTEKAQDLHWNIRPIATVDDAWWSRWDGVNTDHLGAHPLLTSTMAKLLCKYFGNDHLIGVELVQSDAVCLQAIVAPGGRGKYSIFNPSQAPVSLIVFRRSAANYTECFRRLMSKLPGMTVALSFAAQDIPFSAMDGSSALVDRTVWGTTVNVDCSIGFETYWESRSKELKHNMRRYFKRLKEQYGDDWSLVRHDAPDAVASAVDRYAELESRGWKGREGTALRPDNDQGRFYRELLQAYAHSESAAVYELRFGQKLAAARLTVSGPGMHVILKTTYDEELSRLAPGRVLLYLLLEQMFADPRRRPVEFYTRANSDTLAWSTGQRDIESMTLYRNGLISAVVEFKRRLASLSATKDTPPTDQ